MNERVDGSWDLECDFLVAGSGAGGLTGAYTAGREGLQVILAEAADHFGGTTAYSGGGMWFPTNAVLRRAGNVDTIEEARAYYHAVVGDRTPRALQDAFVDGGAPLIDYLEADPLLQFQVYPWPDYYGKVPNARAQGRHIIPADLDRRTLGDLAARMRPTLPVEWAGGRSAADMPTDEPMAGGQALVGRFLMALDAMPNVRLMPRHALVELIEQAGEVIGAVLETDGKRQRVRARLGVLLSSGGFERNESLRRRFNVPTPARWTMGSSENLGRALEAGLAVGADVDLMEECWWCPGILDADGQSRFSVGLLHGIIFDERGHRFDNETMPYDRLGRTMLANYGKPDASELRYWMIFDDRAGPAVPFINTTVPIEDFAPFEAAGLRHRAETLAELADKIGLPAEAVEATVARFNSFAASGVDEDFHRGEEAYDRFFVAGDDPNPAIVPIVKPPFHAVVVTLSDLGTKGGFRTDTAGQVLARDGAPVRGLYAAGNTMAAASGLTYPAGGNPIGSSMLFAHLGARHAAGRKRQEVAA